MRNIALVLICDTYTKELTAIEIIWLARKMRWFNENA